MNNAIVGTVVAFQDVTARRAAQEESARLMQRNTLLLNSAGDGIYGTDLNGRCTFINPAALTMLGYAETDVVGQDQHLLFHYQHADGTPYPHDHCPVKKTLADGITRESEDVFTRQDGSLVPVHLKVTPMVELDQRVGVEVVFQDITERKAMELRLIELATTDSLTGLSNRRHFLDLMTRELVRIQRFGKPAALLMLDLDHFKRINDQYGHGTGDQTLKAFADTLRGTLRQTDQAGRLGGEEFAVLLPHTEGESARLLAERLRERVAALTLASGAASDAEEIRITVSIGYTLLDSRDNHPDSALARADRALYRAKNNGRNRIELEA